MLCKDLNKNKMNSCKYFLLINKKRFLNGILSY